MKPRVLVGLLIAAVAVIALALWMEASRKPASESAATGPAVPGLLKRLDSLDEVRITEAGGKRVATLKRTEDGWQLEEKSFPADADVLRKLMLDLARAKRVEGKTSNRDLYSKLGVEDVSADDAQGVMLELAGGGDPLALIIGSNYSQGTGTYVRVPNEAQSWLINTNVAVDKKTSSWLKKDLLDLQPNRVASVEVVAGNDKVEIGRNEDGDFRLRNLPKGREAASDFAADATAGFLQGLRIEDVAAQPESDRPEVERNAKFGLIDGAELEMAAWQQDSQTWIALAATLDEQKARDYLAAEQAKQVADWQAKQADKMDADSTEGTAADAAAEGAAETTTAAGQTAAEDADAAPEQAPLAVTDPAADLEAKLQALRDEVADWNARFAGRQFQLPSFKAGNLNRQLEAYLKPKD